MEQILITGGAGFIGSNFVDFLIKKCPEMGIIILDNLTYAANISNIPFDKSSNIKFWYGDVCNSSLVDELCSTVDYVVHFAAETHVTRSIFDNKRFFETDVIGTQTVANAVLKNKKKIKLFIHISTSEVYGSTYNGIKIDENFPLNPTSPYAAAKCGADRLIYSYYVCYKIPVVIVRPFNNFGPKQHLEKVIPRFITSVLLNEKLKVHGRGSAVRNWVYVEDCCEAIFNILNFSDRSKIIGEIFNVGTDYSLSVLDIAKKVLEIFEKDSSYIQFVDDRPGQVDCHIADYSKITKILNWVPKTDFHTGLIKTVEWYKHNYNSWQNQIWMREVPIVLENGKIVFH
ncbi:MAG: GDP-mannose 4,6-dehydratase [Calditerrivibrio sp.]|nr:GDP-mannose 4,6-dehydratase [Calditerrivibrio sp.]